GDPPAAVAQLLDSQPPLSNADKYQYVLAQLNAYARRPDRESFVKQWLAEVLTLDAPVAANLLAKWVRSPLNPAQTALAELLKLVDSTGPISSAAFDAQFETFTLLAKIAALITTLELTSRAVTWLFEVGPSR